MNKISKKIVALATMAAFVLTLVPAAAFGAEDTGNTANYEASLSYVGTVDSNENVGVNDKVDVAFEINDANGDPVTTEGTEVATYFWVTDASGNVVRTVNFYSDKADPITDTNEVLTLNQGKVLKLANVSDAKEIKVSFTQPGEYTLHAGANYDLANTITDVTKLSMLKTEDGYATIKVSAEETDVTGLVIDGADKDSDKADTWNAKGNIKPNNTATKTLTVNVKTGEKADKVAKNEAFTIDTSSDNISVTAKDMKGNAFEAGTAVSDRNGQFQLVYTVAKAGEYKIYLESEDGYEAVINVTSDDINVYPADIVATENNAKVLNKDVLNAEATALLTDAVQFEITDNNGNVLENSTLVSDEPAAKNEADKSDYVKLLVKPDKFDRSNASKFSLAWDTTNEVYTLSYTGKDLVEGEYTVRVALEETGEYVDATFTVDKYGKTQSIKIDTDEEVVLGKPVTGKVVEVDENGLEQPMKKGDYSLSITGKALDMSKDNSAVEWTDEKQEVQFSRATIADRFDLLDLVGTQINIIAVSEKYGMATATVTAVAQDSNASLTFDSTNGVADKNNTVVASVVDEDGNLVKDVKGKVYAYVADQSNEDAKVEVNVLNDGDKAVNGKARISIYSNVETSVDVVVAIQADGEGTPIYAATLEYTIGAADVNADKLVAMTIGSSDYIVDNDVVAGDAAPYIDSAWRTMVPIRALAETFGATVDFKDNVITIVDGDTTIVMTVGETAYTVNDEEANMDTAPVIGEGDRTFVPVRFVAEALGYTVTPLQDANGLTASVVFQK